MDRLYFLCLVVCFLSSAVYAEDIKVIFSKGDNYKVPVKGEKTRIQKNSLVEETDKIVVSKSGLVIFKIEGHSVMKLESGTEIVVNKLPYNYEGRDEIEQPGELELKIGTILTDMVKESESETLIIKSKSAALGVRGTKFMVSSEEDLVVSVKEGMVELANSNSEQNDFIQSDESIVMEKGSNFTARHKYSALNDLNWNVEDKNTSGWRSRVRSKLRKEFKKKRKPWKADKKRLAKFKEKWKAKKKAFKQKTRNFKSNQKRKMRLKKIEMRRKTNKRLPSPKDIKNGKRLDPGADRRMESMRQQQRERQRRGQTQRQKIHETKKRQKLERIRLEQP